MDLSSLIFVALFVAWAVYLVPKALRHHEEDAETRSVDGFSDRLRVLARREVVSATEATLVPAGRAVQPARESAEEAPATPTPAPRERSAARRATQRRRRVLGALLLVEAVVAGLAIAGVVAPVWIAAPSALLVAWLVACRVMVKGERAARRATSPLAGAETAEEMPEPLEDAADVAEARADTDEIPAAVAEIADEPIAVDPNAWTPVQVPLPTYVAKATAGRTVRTIDLDSTGVWSSGRNEADSQLAREADAQRAVETEAELDGEQRRASGS